jgi:hypothetical protein
MAALFVSDLTTPADIRLHVLYIFPLAAIALHCARTSAILTGVVLSVALQLSTFLHDGLPKGPLVTDALVAFSSLCVGFGGEGRRTPTATVAGGTNGATGFQIKLRAHSRGRNQHAETLRRVFSWLWLISDDFKNDRKRIQAWLEALADKTKTCATIRLDCVLVG